MPSEPPSQSREHSTQGERETRPTAEPKNSALQPRSSPAQTPSAYPAQPGEHPPQSGRDSGSTHRSTRSHLDLSKEPHKEIDDPMLAVSQKLVPFDTPS